MAKTVKYKGQSFTFETAQEKEARLKRIALGILAECKSEALTVSDFHRMLDMLKKLAEQSTIVNCPLHRSPEH